MDTFEKSPGLSAREAVNHAAALQTAMNRPGDNGKRVLVRLQSGVTASEVHSALGNLRKGITFADTVDSHGNIEVSIFTDETRFSR